MRTAVLDGRILGRDAAVTVRRLARFLDAGLEGLVDWFGEAAFGAAAAAGILHDRIDRDIVSIDRILADQIDAILHDPRYQRLEGSWRGLAWLVDGLDPVAPIHVRVLSVTWREICRDLDRAIEFDQSLLFRMIYENEIGRPGGEPFGLLIIDHEIQHRVARRRAQDAQPVDDVATVAALAALAAAAFAPVVLAASPQLLGVDRFEELALSLDPSTVFLDEEHARWRALSAREDLRFVCITLPRVLARPRWTDDPLRRDGFGYIEYAPEACDRTWSVGCYAFASVVIRSQAQFRWPADIRGSETDRVGGGVVPDLILEPFTTDRSRGWCRQALDLVLTNGQERSLIDVGLIPLNRLPHGNEAMFASVRSLHVPPSFEGGAREGAAASANARVSAQINSMLCASRFAHYLKVMGREMVGSMLTAETIEQRLRKWLADYTNGNLRGGSDSRARYPLVASWVDVRERHDRPGTFGCVIHLQPHYQIDDIEASFRLTTDLSMAGARN